MAFDNVRMVRRIFGGGETQPSGKYDRPLTNPADQAVAETLAVGTHRRVFRGPRGDGPHWSFHISRVTACGATSALNFYYSNMPNPDPTNADHWVASGVSAVDLTSATDILTSVTSVTPEWIKAEAVVANSSGTVWGYVRVNGIEES